MRKRKGKGRNVPASARNYAYEGRKNTKREKKKLQTPGKAILQTSQTQQTNL